MGSVKSGENKDVISCLRSREAMTAQQATVLSRTLVATLDYEAWGEDAPKARFLRKGTDL